MSHQNARLLTKIVSCDSELYSVYRVGAYQPRGLFLYLRCVNNHAGRKAYFKRADCEEEFLKC